MQTSTVTQECFYNTKAGGLITETLHLGHKELKVQISTPASSEHHGNKLRTGPAKEGNLLLVNSNQMKVVDPPLPSPALSLWSFVGKHQVGPDRLHGAGEAR